MKPAACSLTALRSALNHLYEPRALQGSPLIRLAGEAGQRATPARLRQILTQAIESLKPAPDVSAQSAAWRVYEVLYYRYVQQWSQEEVADQLGLSVRHLKREQRKALESLAERLGEQYALEIALVGEPDRDDAAEAQLMEATAGSDLQWLQSLAPGAPVELKAALPAVLDLVRSIAARYAVRLEADLSVPLPSIAVHAVVLRQILLSLLCVAIRRAAGGRLRLSAESRDWAVAIHFQGGGCEPPLAPAAEDDANLAVARQLAGRCGGSLDVSDAADPFRATLALPAAEQVSVLVIDDNPDAVRLLQRYASGTRYLISGARDPEQAFAAACESAPQIIVLDVMMPEVDGWEFLGRLKQHPATSGIPVAVCTILAQEELAFSLGVSAFLRKPVSRQDFLAALDRLVSSPAP